MSCPRCGGALGPEGGAAWSCAACNRGFVTEAVLVRRAEAMSGRREPVSSSPPATGDACPICRAAMEPGRLGTVAIERCALHGVWFDRNALAEALYAASQGRTGRERREDASRSRDGFAAFLAELFWFL